MRKLGEAFVALALLFIIFSYATPWTWQTDAAVIAILFGIGMAMNAQARR